MTKDKLLEAARTLMLEKGYTAATVDEICARAGVTKGAFFHHFESKEALGAATIPYSYGRRRQIYEDVRAKEPPSKKRFRHYVKALTAALATGPGPRGCLMGNIVQELHQTNPHLRDVCAVQLKDWQELLAEDLGPEQAELFLAVFEGAIILAKARAEPTLVPKLLNLYGRLL